MSTKISYKHASFMRRLIAALLDGVLIWLFGSVLVNGICHAVYPTQPQLLLEGVIMVTMISFPAYFITEILGFPVALSLAILLWRSYDQVAPWGCPYSQVVPTAARVFTVILFSLLPLLISSIYHGLMESLLTKATLGKLAMGILVSDLNGNKISSVRAMFRYLARGLSTSTFGVGYFMALGKTGQALHDKLTGCIVIRDGYLI